MTSRRILVRLFAIGAIASLPLVAWAGAASAQSAGACLGTINGQVASGTTPGNPVVVGVHQTVVVTGTAPGRVTGHDIDLEFAGIRWTVSSKADSGKSNTWRGVAHIAEHAKYGVGLYKVVGVTSGPGACSGSGYVKVTGRNALTTVAGIGSLILTLLGLGSMIGSARRSRRVSRERRRGWHVRVGVLGLVGGLVAAIGALVLLQQFAVVYPTRIVSIIALALGLLLGGFLFPSALTAGTGGGATPPPVPDQSSAATPA